MTAALKNFHLFSSLKSSSNVTFLSIFMLHEINVSRNFQLHKLFQLHKKYDMGIVIFYILFFATTELLLYLQPNDRMRWKDKALEFKTVAVEKHHSICTLFIKHNLYKLQDRTRTKGSFHPFH